MTRSTHGIAPAIKSGPSVDHKSTNVLETHALRYEGNTELQRLRIEAPDHPADGRTLRPSEIVRRAGFSKVIHTTRPENLNAILASGELRPGSQVQQSLCGDPIGNHTGVFLSLVRNDEDIERLLEFTGNRLPVLVYDLDLLDRISFHLTPSYVFGSERSTTGTSDDAASLQRALHDSKTVRQNEVFVDGSVRAPTSNVIVSRGTKVDPREAQRVTEVDALVTRGVRRPFMDPVLGPYSASSDGIVRFAIQSGRALGVELIDLIAREYPEIRALIDQAIPNQERTRWQMLRDELEQWSTGFASRLHTRPELASLQLDRVIDRVRLAMIDDGATPARGSQFAASAMALFGLKRDGAFAPPRKAPPVTASSESKRFTQLGSLVCNAEPFGFGPAAALQQLFVYLRDHTLNLEYAGEEHTLEMHGGLAYDSVQHVKASALGEVASAAGSMLVICDHEAAARAKKAGAFVILYDPLAWFWREMPQACRDVDVYVCPEFYGVRERLTDLGMKNAVVVPPMIPQGTGLPAHERANVLVNLGGLANPMWEDAVVARYAESVLNAVAESHVGKLGQVRCSTSKRVASQVDVRMDLCAFDPPQIHALLATSKLALMTPGLGNINEAAALSENVLWLPPANDSQGQQLRILQERGLAPLAIDWHDILPIPPIDYRAPQREVMKHLERCVLALGSSPEAQKCLGEKINDAVDTASRSDSPPPLRSLIDDFGQDGARIAANVIIEAAAKSEQARSALRPTMAYEVVASMAGRVTLDCTVDLEPTLREAMQSATRRANGTIRLKRTQTAILDDGREPFVSDLIAHAQGHDVEHLYSSVLWRGLGMPTGRISRALNEVLTASLFSAFERDLEGEAYRPDRFGEARARKQIRDGYVETMIIAANGGAGVALPNTPGDNMAEFRRRRLAAARRADPDFLKTKRTLERLCDRVGALRRRIPDSARARWRRSADEFSEWYVAALAPAAKDVEVALSIDPKSTRQALDTLAKKWRKVHTVTRRMSVAVGLEEVLTPEEYGALVKDPKYGRLRREILRLVWSLPAVWTQ